LDVLENHAGSATGSQTGSTNNLKQDFFEAFANYLANVTLHFEKDFNITFDSIAPLNEAGNGSRQFQSFFFSFVIFSSVREYRF
jgi:hypothetical protein